MLLIRNEGVAMEGLSEAETAEHMAKWGAWMGGLQEQGKLSGGLPLSSGGAVLSNNGNSVSDGIYTCGKDVNVGGYLLINAANMDEAIAISKGCPALESPTSSVEVRECMQMTAPAEG